jgi:hypothetical protein
MARFIRNFAEKSETPKKIAVIKNAKIDIGGEYRISGHVSPLC